MLLPIFLPEMLSDMLALWFGMTPLMSSKPNYVLMLLIHNAILYQKKKKRNVHIFGA